jgi:hypothetical protein
MWRLLGPHRRRQTRQCPTLLQRSHGSCPFLLWVFVKRSFLTRTLARSYVSSWKNDRMQSWRPLSEFASTQRVGLPQGAVALKQRVFSNVPYFLTNYLMVALVFGVLTLLLPPLLAVLVSLPIVLYAYLFVWKRDAAWTLPVVGAAVGEREKYVAVGLVFALVFLYAASDLIWVFGITVIVVATHAVVYKSREEHETDTLFE